MPLKPPKTVVILSITSDIGFDLAKRYLKKGYRVIGTFRSRTHVNELKTYRHCHLIHCDVGQKASVGRFIREFGKLNFSWQTFICAVGWTRPLTAFFEGPFDRWSDSISINALGPLRVLHGLYPFRDPERTCDAVFFSGPGTNNAVVKFSGYALSKQLLIKMAEFLDAENRDLNVFVVGPGWTRTKNHFEILKDKEISPEKYSETMDFLKNRRGTPLKEIFDCIEWLCHRGKLVSGGRNFSVVHDGWKGPKRKEFAKALTDDPNMYKLRRFKNDFWDRSRR